MPAFPPHQLAALEDASIAETAPPALPPPPPASPSSTEQPPVLAEPDAEVPAQILKRLRDLKRRGARFEISINIEIGKNINEAKRLCGHGNFLPYVEKTCGIKQRHARYCARADECFGKNPDAVRDLTMRAVNELCADSAPAAAYRQEFIEKSQRGEQVTSQDVIRGVAEQKAKHKPEKSADPVQIDPVKDHPEASGADPKPKDSHTVPELIPPEATDNSSRPEAPPAATQVTPEKIAEILFNAFKDDPENLEAVTDLLYSNHGSVFAKEIEVHRHRQSTVRTMIEGFEGQASALIP